MATASPEQKLNFAIVKHLKACFATADADVLKAVELLEGALVAPDVDPKALEYEESLATLFEAGVAAKEALTRHEKQSESGIEGDPLFQQLLQSLTKRGFFAGVEPNTPEYEARYQRAVAQYEKRRAPLQPKTAPRAPAEKGEEGSWSDLPRRLKLSTDEADVWCLESKVAPDSEQQTQEQADALKAEGNDMLKKGSWCGFLERSGPYRRQIRHQIRLILCT
eukprot:scaffold434_cov186-Pinguiococcus_pyrenoidosus.AAC.72